MAMNNPLGWGIIKLFLFIRLLMSHTLKKKIISKKRNILINNDAFLRKKRAGRKRVF